MGRLYKPTRKLKNGKTVVVYRIPGLIQEKEYP
jgi:hypothetical protein